VRPYIGSSDQWTQRLRTLIIWSLKPELVDLAVELTERGDLDGARGPIAVNSDFWTILYGLKTEAPGAAARLIGAYLQRALVRANCGDPFASEHLNQYSTAGGASTIVEIATGAPTVFLTEVLPFVTKVAEAVASHEMPGGLRHSKYWGYPHTGERHGILDALYGGVEDAMLSYVRETPAEALALVWQLAASDLHDLRFLACRALAAGRVGNEAVGWLLGDGRNLCLGWADSPQWATRELVEAATASCDDAHLNSLTESLLTYYSAWEKTREGRSSRGYAQYELLSGIAPSRRSDAARRRIGEWERKFSGRPPVGPRAMEFGVVDAPIPVTGAPFLTDEDWARAIEKYTNDTTDWRGAHPVGGVRQLAGLLRSRAEAEPERFARFALTFKATTPPRRDRGSRQQRVDSPARPTLSSCP
jgi:hypothetical protein